MIVWNLRFGFICFRSLNFPNVLEMKVYSSFVGYNSLSICVHYINLCNCADHICIVPDFFFFSSWYISYWERFSIEDKWIYQFDPTGLSIFALHVFNLGIQVQRCDIVWSLLMFYFLLQSILCLILIMLHQVIVVITCLAFFLFFYFQLSCIPFCACMCTLVCVSMCVLVVLWKDK